MHLWLWSAAKGEGSEPRSEPPRLFPFEYGTNAPSAAGWLISDAVEAGW